VKRGRNLRTRLLVAFLVFALAVLAFAGTATYLLVRQTARHQTINQLESKAQVVVSQNGGLRRLVASALSAQSGNPGVAADYVAGVNAVLRLANAHVVFLTPDGRLQSGPEAGIIGARNAQIASTFSLPPGITESDLLPRSLLAGNTVRGNSGSTAYIAEPLPDQQTLQRRLLRRAAAENQQPILVLTDTFKTNFFGQAGPWLLITLVGAVLVCVAVSFVLARQLTRPMREIQAAARKLAAGDLSARAVVPGHTDDDIAALATTLNTMAEQLEQARGSERAFLLSISHDLRTPLTSIRGYAEALADGTLDDSDPEARARAAAVITSEARRLERLVRDLLDLSRLDSRQFSLHPRQCDASGVVSEAAEAFVPATNDMGVALQVHRNGAITADLDPERLAQIVANLVENALKYATNQVDVFVDRDDTGVAVAVVDDGPGVSSGDLNRVFERLYTGRDAPGRAVGTGLGLAIVRELTHAMGGDARAERAANGGSRFVVHVPVGAGHL
jgi:two-component system sensor histidine kinase BaeS